MLADAQQRLANAEAVQAAAEEALKLADRRYQHADERVAEAREELEVAQRDRDAARKVRWREWQAYERAAARVERARKRVEEFEQPPQRTWRADSPVQRAASAGRERLGLPVILVVADPVAVAGASRIGGADSEAVPSLMRQSRPGLNARLAISHPDRSTRRGPLREDGIDN